MKTFSIQYCLGGATYSVNIKADDWDHALLHLFALIQSGVVVGEVVAEIEL